MTNKLKYFIANWKMFGDFSSIKIIHRVDRFVRKFNKLSNNNKIILCVPSTLIYFFSTKIKSKFISLGAQNSHHSSNYGPYTGSVNASMLKKVGARIYNIGTFRK